MDKMTHVEAQEAAKELTQWMLAGDAIEWEREFPSFAEAMAFVNRVAALAEAANHHPGIFNSWRTVRLSLSTHDAGGLTHRDFDMARRIEAL